MFYGLEVNERMEIDEGVFLAPYTKIVELGLINEREPFPWDDIPDYRELNAVALVRDLSWGPGIGPPMSGLDSFGTVPNVTFRYLDSHENHSVIFDFLTITTRHELTILSVDYYPDKSMEDIDPIYNRDLKPNFFTPPRLNTRKLFTEQDVAKLQGLLCVWAGYEQDRNILDLAIRRLASSISRKGRFELADRILDIAVALEIMYKLEGPEITYKLATRTAYFVGADAEQRHDLFKKIRSFYEVRSSIVHRGMARTHTGTFKNAADDGFELAYNTLSKLLDQGETPDWNKLVVTGEC